MHTKAWHERSKTRCNVCGVWERWLKSLADPNDQWCSCGVYHPAIDFTCWLLFRFLPSLLAFFAVLCCCFAFRISGVFFCICPPLYGHFAYKFFFGVGIVFRINIAALRFHFFVASFDFSLCTFKEMSVRFWTS